jgi:predicted nucleotidyltransferase
MNDLVNSRRAELAELCKRLHVRRLDAFGSVVTRAFDQSSSDIDFVVEFEPLTPAEYADAYFSLKEGLEAIFRRSVDLITESALANPYFRHSVETTRQQVYAA